MSVSFKEIIVSGFFFVKVGSLLYKLRDYDMWPTIVQLMVVIASWTWFYSGTGRLVK
jgi:hypothetical protein